MAEVEAGKYHGAYSAVHLSTQQDIVQLPGSNVHNLERTRQRRDHSQKSLTVANALAAGGFSRAVSREGAS